jgi:hypothetical protein
MSGSAWSSCRPAAPRTTSVRREPPEPGE